MDKGRRKLASRGKAVKSNYIDSSQMMEHSVRIMNSQKKLDGVVLNTKDDNDY